MNYLYFTLAVSVLGLFATWALTRLMQRQPEGTPEMMVIANAIRAGANAFLKRLFSTIAIIAARMGAGAPAACSSRREANGR